MFYELAKTAMLCVKPGMHDQVMADSMINSFPLGQNGRHFANDIFRCIFVNEKFCILIKLSMKFPKGQIDNK